MVLISTKSRGIFTRIWVEQDSTGGLSTGFSVSLGLPGRTTDLRINKFVEGDRRRGLIGTLFVVEGGLGNFRGTIYEFDISFSNR